MTTWARAIYFFISDAVHAHRCASDAHRCASAKIGAWPTLVGSLFWVSICSSAACFPGSGRKEELGKMEEPGLNFCRARFAIVLWTFCDFFSTFLPLAVNQHLIAACQCQNKSPAHFLLRIIAIFQSQSLKCEAIKDQMKKMKIFKDQFLNFFDAANQKK